MLQAHTCPGFRRFWAKMGQTKSDSLTAPILAPRAQTVAEAPRVASEAEPSAVDASTQAHRAGPSETWNMSSCRAASQLLFMRREAERDAETLHLQ